MSFIWPVMLFALLLVPVLVVVYVILQRRRKRLVVSYGSLGFMQKSAGKQVGFRVELGQCGGDNA